MAFHEQVRFGDTAIGGQRELAGFVERASAVAGIASATSYAPRSPTMSPSRRSLREGTTVVARVLDVLVDDQWGEIRTWDAADPPHTEEPPSAAPTIGTLLITDRGGRPGAALADPNRQRGSRFSGVLAADRVRAVWSGSAIASIPPRPRAVGSTPYAIAATLQSAAIMALPRPTLCVPRIPSRRPSSGSGPGTPNTPRRHPVLGPAMP